MRSLASCSNITPLCIDEINIIATKRYTPLAVNLFSVLRCAYDNKLLNQGTVNDKLKEFKLCAPIIISGETELSDVSLKNRIVPVLLSKGNKADLEVYEKFKNSDILYRLGMEVLEARLKGKVRISLQETKRIEPSVKDDRQLYNCKCLVQCFLAIKNFINCTSELEENFYSYLDTMFSNEYTPEKNFIALLNLVVESGDSLVNFYINDSHGHYSNFSPLYKSISLEHERTNSTLELLDMATLKRQLRECGFILERTSKRFGTSRDRTFSAYIFRSCDKFFEAKLKV